MQKLMLSFILLALTACAGVTDVDREFFTDYTVTKRLDMAATPEQAEQRAGLYLRFAAATDIAVRSGATGSIVKGVIERWVDMQKLDAADQKMVGYLVAKMLPAEIDLALPLTAEHRRVISVYTQSIRDSVALWRQSK